MNYPPKPWNDGQTFIDNGTVYVYDSAMNSWNFSNLTYNRLSNAIQIETPDELSTFRIEFSENQSFDTLARTYDSTVESDRSQMFIFSNGSYDNISGSEVNKEISERLILIPEIDKNRRYFGRYRWTTNGENEKWHPIIISGGNGSTDISN